ncbi:MAG TPA: tRNA pseudouridine(55) synthase TruB [Longimicrobiales bacterium]|nr:tRNA pseudouridine(55) synthase TruB [Longimicrobiales bacterium]
MRTPGGKGRSDVAGVLRVDKVEGPTSHDVVAAARRALGVRRIGHTGTLDPFASGLLLLCFGWVTRIAEFLVGLPKTYLAVARLGEETDTDDRTGTVVASTDAWQELSRDRIVAAFGAMVGRIRQVPPRYSAKKVAGERLYRAARRGEELRAEAAEVEIHALDVLAIDLPFVSFRVECSSGTYVRAIARDVGRALGVGAHLTELRRTRIGGHDVAGAVRSDALSDDDAVRAAWLTPLEALSHLPVVELSLADAKRIAHGMSIAPPVGEWSGEVVALARDGRLLAVGDARPDRISPRKVFSSV